MTLSDLTSDSIPPFDRHFFTSGQAIVRLGDGDIGGKAHGLLAAMNMIRARFSPEQSHDFTVSVPRMVVITTDVFRSFLDRNDLRGLAASNLPDERIAHAFQQASLPTEIVGDLRAITEEVHTPLAVRSSSLLEDALFRPFAGIYETKMTPNNQPDPADRYRKLVEAVKFVWSSTFFRAAQNYIRTTEKTIEDEQMAVIIQEVVGEPFGDRYYPHLSGVCRSYNFYPSARSKPEEGVVNLALGLGKTIVDGGITWSYTPARPNLPPPFASVQDQMRNTQTTFWAVNMGRPPEFNPIAEAEYLIQADLSDAEFDGALDYLASTYLTQSDRLSPGVGNPGPRVLNFAPLLQLKEYKLNDLIKQLLAMCEDVLAAPVEIEFAVTLPRRNSDERARFGFLQVRPMVVSDTAVEVTDDEMQSPDLLAASSRVLGNGINDQITDVIYVKPDTFHARHNPAIASELNEINTTLLQARRPYLLIGFGRWGSSDPWLGIPVNWGQICNARAIIEATLPDFAVDLSQGSHFFHNLSSFEVSYFMIQHHTQPGINWSRLDSLPAESETRFIRHVRVPGPMIIKVDGRVGRGVIMFPTDTPL